MAKPVTKPHPKLYCGTTERIAKVAPVAGLSPNAGPIYLTDVYAGLLAFYASTSSTERLGIIEVDLTLLDQANFLPSEWYLEQTSRQRGKTEREQQKRREVLRKTLEKQAAKWKKSQQEIGVVVYDASIPKKAVTRITVYDPSSNPVITEAVIGQRISLSDYKRNYERSRALTRWLMGEEVTVDDWLGDDINAVTKEEKQRLAEWLQNKSGLDIFYHEPLTRGL